MLKEEKVSICMGLLPFSDHFIRKVNGRVDPQNVKVAAVWLVPTKVSGLQSFLDWSTIIRYLSRTIVAC